MRAALTDAHTAFLATAQAQPPRALKGRAVCLDTYQMAEGLPSSAFVHVTLRLLPGRTPETKKSLIELILKTIAPHLPTHIPISLTGEVVEMPAETYVKHEFNF